MIETLNLYLDAELGSESSFSIQENQTKIDIE